MEEAPHCPTVLATEMAAKVEVFVAGPRFWCKNFGFKNGFTIGFRNSFRILTLEKVQKWEVCTCHKIKLASKAIFKAVFKAKLFAPESGPCSLHIFQLSSLGHINYWLKSLHLHTTFACRVNDVPLTASVVAYGVFPRRAVGSPSNPRILRGRVFTHAARKPSVRSAPPMFSPIHYLWYTQKNEGIIYFAANDDYAGLANIDRGSLMGGQMSIPRSALQPGRFILISC